MSDTTNSVTFELEDLDLGELTVTSMRDTVALMPQLCDALHASHGDHPLRFHHDVVLPLRRALHNGREPRPGLLDRLGDLPQRVPHLAAWLALRQRRQDLLARLAGTAADA